MPAGDLDRDGMPDVLVRRGRSRRGIDPPASLPLEILSGRSGRQLWSAGSIPPLGFPSVGYCRIVRTEARVCEPGKPPDLIVVYELPGGNVQMRLARLSGRDGGFVWDALLFKQQPGAIMAFADEPAFGDLDGDGCLDATLPLHFVFPISGGPPGARSTSCGRSRSRHGKLLWRRPGPPGVVNRIDFGVGDLDGDGRAEVVLSTVLPGPFRQRGRGFIELTALEGNDGSTRWTWRDDYVVDTESVIPHFALGDLDGKGRKEVCISLPGETGRRLVILDGQGQERNPHDRALLRAGHARWSARGSRRRRPRRVPRRTLVRPWISTATAATSSCLRDDKRLSASRSDLTGLWAWRDPPLVREILPAEHGRPATVLLKSGLGLDGVTGRAIWSAGRFDAVLADQAGTSGPRVLDSREGATVCRLSIPTSGEGRYLPPHGVAALRCAARRSALGNGRCHGLVCPIVFRCFTCSWPESMWEHRWESSGWPRAGHPEPATAAGTSRDGGDPDDRAVVARYIVLPGPRPRLDRQNGVDCGLSRGGSAAFGLRGIAGSGPVARCGASAHFGRTDGIGQCACGRLMALFRNQADARARALRLRRLVPRRLVRCIRYRRALALEPPGQGPGPDRAAAGPQERARCSSFVVSTAKSHRRQ